MSEVKINEIKLEFNSADEFARIKEHMEMCAEEEINNEFVAMELILIGMKYYKFL